MVQLKVAPSNNKLAYSNRVYVSKDSFQALQKAAEAKHLVVSASDPAINVTVGSLVFLVSPNNEVENGTIALNSKQRNCGSFTLAQDVSVDAFVPGAHEQLATLTVGVDVLGKKTNQKLELNADELSASFKNQFNDQVFTVRQQLAMDFNGIKLDVVVEDVENAVVDGHSAAASSNRGQLSSQVTNLTWKKIPGSQTPIVFTGTSAASQRNDSLFKRDFNFENLGIGGLDEQFQKMFRSAFASRLFPGLVKRLGVNHVRGILLFGPPGCGKTLIARQIGKVLNAREPKIVNGPEILDKFVGGSEEKIRALFADAEKEQAEMGDASMLHIIIFDEMDAIMKSRGSTRDSTGVQDSIVNQLLSKIDGVDSLNNILIIGMTNRKDLIDEAILRPGRLEVHIEVSLPDEHGRQQIIHIKTAEMRKHNLMSTEAIEKIPHLAHLTKNYTGAELEGMVRAAVSFAMARNIDAASMKTMDESAVLVEYRDFERAVGEVVPAFGNKNNEEVNACFRNGICNYGRSYEDMWSTLNKLVAQTRNSARTPLMSVLLEGNTGCGKTAIAAKLAADSDFPFVRMLSADTMIGYPEAMKCSTLLKTFTDAYRSPLSIIFIDDIERIIEYTPVGFRFSNTILQTLLILLKKVPPEGSRVMVIATTSIAHLLEDLQITQAFNINVHVSELQEPSEIDAVLRQYSELSPDNTMRIAKSITKPIGIKQLLMVLEMARATSDSDSISVDNFLQCLHAIGY